MSSLSGFSDAELEAELALRKRHCGEVREPAFKCSRCGASEHYQGHWSAWLYELQANQFVERHRDCKIRGSIVIAALNGEL